MATVQGLYIALFGRPADPLGLAYFNSATSGGANLAGLPPLNGSAEYQSLFAGQSITQTVNAIHRSLFNRDAQAQALTALADEVSTGVLSINKLAIAIIDSASGNDLNILNNKLAAANAFTAAVDTAVEIEGYSGTAAANIGRVFLATVDMTIPLKSTLDNAVLRATGTAEIVLLLNKPLGSITVQAMPVDVVASAGPDQAAWASAISAIAPEQAADVGQDIGGVDAFVSTLPTLMGGLLPDAIWIA